MTQETKTEMNDNDGFLYCHVPQMPVRTFAPDVSPERLRAIGVTLKKWLNGTVLHYYFFDKPTDGSKVNGQWVTWTSNDTQKNVVRAAFKVWKDVGIGLKFKEVFNREDAEIRIGFMQGDGSWSYVGRDILSQGKQERTMNFGWDLTKDFNAAIHEIGHTLGFEHEHQNPKAGIVWNEEAVYQSLARPPNSWSRPVTYSNIIRKLDVTGREGSDWDPNSIMHYPFGAGLIKEPAKYRTGLVPKGGLSENDKLWVRTWYPASTPPKPDNNGSTPPSTATILEPAKSFLLKLKSGEQQDFRLHPPSSRTYELRTFGKCDTVFVLYEVEANGHLRMLGGDDDSGDNRNAYMKLKLFHDRKYLLRIRVNYVENSAVIMWW